MGVLDDILESKRAELATLAERALPEAPARRAVALRREPGTPLRLIAEIKRRSPSAGRLSTRLSVAERARTYQAAGACMLSVLTDTRFFDGAFEHLGEARNATELPILCKDFVIDERQLACARAFGADLVLLIVRCLTRARLSDLVVAARALELEPFVEVASETEAEHALGAGAAIVGVNTRDLDTLEMNPARAERVLRALPSSVVRVHLSGLSTPDDVARVAARDVDAALVGEALMREDDPSRLLQSLVARAG